MVMRLRSGSSVGPVRRTVRQPQSWLVILLMVVVAASAAAQPGDILPATTSTADHRQFEALQGPFATGPDVTRACLGCHTEAAKQVHDSIHWTWEYTHPTTGQRLGKRYVVNNYCGSITTNYPRCTSCHVGFGWEDASFDFSREENVDCLVCHDTTGDYVKFPTGAGHPPYQDRVFGGKTIAAPDLTQVAQNVGPTSRETCGNCHFKGGGGDGVKHGDLDSSLYHPSKSVDVHMDSEGLNFSCSTCHEFNNHIQQGSRYLVKAKSTEGVTVPGRENARPSCESCHGSAPHEAGIHDKLNEHSDSVACQTCHIPTFARGGRPTKTWWDWSTAGQLNADGKPVIRKAGGLVTYHGKKGDFVWDENVVPEYRWFDGTVRYTLLGESLDPSNGPVELNTVTGSPDDPNSRIWPFKVMRGIQPYDSGHNQLVIEYLFGKDEAAFWKSFDWGKAIEVAMTEAKQVGQTHVDYSGEYGFTETEMYWPLAHMVAPADEALTCESCHRADGRLENVEGFYLPGRDRHPLLELAGLSLIGLTFLGVVGHGATRMVTARICRTRTKAEDEE